MQKMTISDAKRRITQQRVVSVALGLIASVSLLCAALKGIYVSLDGDISVLSSVSRNIQRLVYTAYEKTQFMSWFWKWSPVLNARELNTPGNWGGLFLLMCLLISRLMWDSASNLSLRVTKAMQRVEEAAWERELLGGSPQKPDKKPGVLQINIELEQNDQWYKRPLGLVSLGTATAILGQWANLRFGLILP